MRLPKITKPYHMKDFRFTLVITVLVLSVLGILVIGSANESVQVKQIVGLVVGMIAMIVISLIDYVWVLNLYWIIYGFNLSL